MLRFFYVPTKAGTLNPEWLLIQETTYEEGDHFRFVNYFLSLFDL
jgi:hypothetical protein